MKHISFLIILLLIPFALGDIAVSTTQKQFSGPVFTVDGSEGISITPNRDVGETHVFVDGISTEVFTSISAGDTKTVEASVGQHDIEVRSIIDHSYSWDNYKILENDAPFVLDYVSYDREREYINFVIKGAQAIHPDDISSTKTSLKKPFEDYTTLLNGKKELNCYPLITTGKSIPFNCYAGAYPYTIDIDVTIGMRETYNVSVQSVYTPTEEPEEITDTPDITTTPDKTPETITPPFNEEIEVKDDIVMEDIIPKQKDGLSTALQWAFFVLLIAVVSILYIASHHKVENKRAGKHHPQKKKAVKQPAQKPEQPKKPEQPPQHDLSYLNKK